MKGLSGIRGSGLGGHGAGWEGYLLVGIKVGTWEAWFVASEWDLSNRQKNPITGVLQLHH